ncbi:hypothetical protein ABEH54_004119 [Yersinia enterocolitica]
MLELGTSWRQGQILKHDDAVALKLLTPEDTGSKVVVITHDCDLQSSSEKNIEVIVGPLKKGSSQRTRAKHPRILDLCFLRQVDTSFNAIELRHENKVILPKNDFVCEECDTEYSISVEEKQGLKQWLAAKYGRPAFPDVFEERLRAFDTKKIKFEKEIAQIIGTRSDNLIGIFFDLGEDRFNDLEEGIPYELSINVVYDAVEGGIEARESAEKTCAEIQALFIQYYGDPNQGQSELIAMEKCISIADTHFSLYALRRMDQWRVEYISLEDESSGDFIGAGV